MSTRSNKNLHRAKRNKNDEFYTRYEDIEKELKFYNLRDKIVYCPCDDYRWSNFVRYFKENFHALGLKKLYASNYDIGEGAYDYSYNGIVETSIRRGGSGGYREHEDMIRAADIVITNPPFSLFRDFVNWIVENGKSFLIIGPLTAMQYTNVFKLIKEEKCFTGITSPKKFLQKSEEKDPPRIVWIESNDMGGSTVQWYNSIERKKYATLTLTKTYKGHEEEYPKYDNFEAINVDRIKDIPYDYEGVMGVPITFLKGYYPEYEIMDLHSDTAIRGGEEWKYKRVTVKKKQS